MEELSSFGKIWTAFLRSGCISLRTYQKTLSSLTKAIFFWSERFQRQSFPCCHPIWYYSQPFLKTLGLGSRSSPSPKIQELHPLTLTPPVSSPKKEMKLSRASPIFCLSGPITSLSWPCKNPRNIQYFSGAAHLYIPNVLLGQMMMALSSLLLRSSQMQRPFSPTYSWQTKDFTFLKLKGSET